jgi:RHS repeat-associated protein
MIDPLNHTTSFSYDQKGNLITATDALNHQTSLAYNTAGQVSSVTDALNNVVQFGYFGGDLVSVTDPLGNVSSSFYDAAGRVVSATDPQGNTVKTQYNSLNLVTQVTDPKGNNTAFSYDPNGNLLSLTDAANHTTSYTYDNMDRILTRTDPLLRQESYSYDLNGNLVNSTDRKSQVTSMTYDPLNRLKLVGYNTVVHGGITSYESTVGYIYDAGNRMTQAVDSAGGTITEAYDNLDRLTSETTPQGQISYGYDVAGRRASMTVAGQLQVTYSYDNANRLTQIAQGTSTVGFSYDTANRRSTLTLSNGVNMAYTYDNDSRVTGITYKFNTNTLGNLTYSYDSLGRRTQVGGSFAQTGLPGSITSATCDAANELTNWNGTALSYDLNGNMLSDGGNTFTWNARNQVATLNSVSLQYDGFGRRTKNLQSTSFLFDGANAVQELSGSTATANLISGGIDEIFTRADSIGAYTPLKDALGSTIALVDASGALVTQYAYDPFGNTTLSGAASGNPSQYTGRENEGNGLYFYRARYYSPLLGRFVNQDPLGFMGSGPNLYAYVLDSPMNLVDPTGLESGATYYQEWKMDVCPGQAQCPMKQDPNIGVRSPDYYSGTLTGPWVGVNVIRDKNASWYWTPVFAPPGIGGWKIGGSLTAGYLDNGYELHGRKPTATEIHDFVHAWGAQGCGGVAIVYCRTYSPGSGWADEIGLGTPQLGVSGGYTFDGQDTRRIIDWIVKNGPQRPPL